MALTKCKECGNQVSTAALTCPRCGAPQKETPPPLPSTIAAHQPPPIQRAQPDRMESTVVQVAPSYENDKIQEMQMFGWNLQGRQEIHEEGNAETHGRPSYVSSNTYVVKTTTTVKQYVKLHFTRSLNLPNLDQVKQIEAEYLSLPFPGPGSLVGPIVLMGLIGIGGVYPAFARMGHNVARGLGELVFWGVFIALGYLWLTTRLKKRRQAAATCAKSAARMQELRAALSPLTA